jgi:hypothetical protein
VTFTWQSAFVLDGDIIEFQLPFTTSSGHGFFIRHIHSSILAAAAARVYVHGFMEKRASEDKQRQKKK